MTNDKVLFCIYARKSQETDERQALSIDSQLSELQAIAKRDGLTVIATRTEAHSAKQASKKPVFMELLVIAPVRDDEIIDPVTMENTNFQESMNYPAAS